MQDFGVILIVEIAGAVFLIGMQLYIWSFFGAAEESGVTAVSNDSGDEATAAAAG